MFFESAIVCEVSADSTADSAADSLYIPLYEKCFPTIELSQIIYIL